MGQRLLGEYVQAYQELIHPLRDAGMACNYDFAADGNYREWKLADEALIAKLNLLLAQSRYETLRRTLFVKQSAAHIEARQYWA